MVESRSTPPSPFPTPEGSGPWVGLIWRGREKTFQEALHAVGEKIPPPEGSGVGLIRRGCEKNPLIALRAVGDSGRKQKSLP